jgi:hypothetical protein
MAGPDPGTEAAFCRVAGVIGKEIRFEVWLPPQWNGRLLNVGNGGLTGAINYPAMAAALASGFATGSTDTGHVTDKDFFDADWMLDDVVEDAVAAAVLAGIEPRATAMLARLDKLPGKLGFT